MLKQYFEHSRKTYKMLSNNINTVKKCNFDSTISFYKSYKCMTIRGTLTDISSYAISLGI